MELNRSIYKNLLGWKKKNTGRVLLFEGARHVGKTYILKKFGEENFSKMIYMDMTEASGQRFLKHFFNVSDWKPGETREETPLQKAIELYDSEFVDAKDTIIIIDEIQESSKIYNQIRTFAREFQSYVIVAGSYLGKTEEKKFFLPAGDIDHMIMESLTFEEFLDAFGERKLYETIDLQGKGQATDYEKLANYYEVYRKIGGYPSVIASYVNDKDMDKCFEIIRETVNVFVDESKHYFTNAIDANFFQKVFSGIARLMWENKSVYDLPMELYKIICQGENENYTKETIARAVNWIQESHIIGYASEVVDCDYKQIRSKCRYYFCDVGLAHFFLEEMGLSFEASQEILAENFVYLALKRKIENTREIAGIVPWFSASEKISGELDFYVRSQTDYKNYGVKVKDMDSSAGTERKLLEDKKLDYLYLLKSETKGGVVEGKVYVVELCLADRIRF